MSASASYAVLSSETAMAPIGFRDMLGAFFVSARRLRATRSAAHAAQIREVVSTYTDRALADVALGRLDFAAIRGSSFRTRGAI